MKEQQPASKKSVAADEKWKTQAGKPRNPHFPNGPGRRENIFPPDGSPDWGTEWELHEDAFLF